LTTFFLQRDCFYAKTSLGLFRDVSSFLVSSFKKQQSFPHSAGGHNKQQHPCN